MYLYILYIKKKNKQKKCGYNIPLSKRTFKGHLEVKDELYIHFTFV